MKSKLRGLLVAGTVSMMLAQPVVADEVNVDPWKALIGRCLALTMV